MIDAAEVNRLMAVNMRAFCETFFPQGILRGKEWCVGNVQGDRGDSMSICLEGSRAGTYIDNNPASDLKPGTPIDLYMQHKGIVDFRKAFVDCKDWLGRIGVLREDVIPRHVAGIPAHHKVAREAVKVACDWNPLREGSVAWKYLTEERFISPDALKAWKVGESPVWFAEAKKKVSAIAFPAYSADGEELLMAKYLGVERPDGKKLVRSNKAAEYHLLGMHACDPAKKTLVICEGEIDALTFITEGINAVSVPFGAKGDNKGNAWVENDWEWLEPWQDIVLAMDGDEAGRVAEAALLARIGKERCRALRWPSGIKDANDAALNTEPLGPLVDAAEAFDPEDLKRARDFEKAIYEEFYPPNDELPGLPVPWKGDHFPFRFRWGETTLWTGYSKHGKTVCQTFCAVHQAAAFGERVAIASLEMPAKKTLKNALRMVMGRSKPEVQGEFSPALWREGISWLNDHFFIYDRVGEVKVDDVLATFAYCVRRYGVRVFIIDSLMKLDVQEDDHEGQKQAMNKITAFAKDYGAHVHIVAHCKKSTEKRPEEKHWPRKHDVNGSVHLTNLPDNIVAVWRNRLKEMDLARLEAMPDHTAGQEAEKRVEMENLMKKEDAIFLVLGQRDGDGEEPVLRLFFDVGASWQYGDEPNFDPRNFLSTAK
ncbi:toprim domain-containing protein [Ruficoccus sp. ZRK36]|uniref:toprim domain-containing protein n=1 Tax=Ruficoccus sp. ZRK36 TaxID=2866311 RepID=UPI001C72CD45|nr:toprim domain-containing protein [Ruficoccus sp. ZRK36]QYY35302.1 toprim domain-containing protein [Ruficoccus sp. ZRK36]